MGNCICCSCSRTLVSKKKKRFVESRTKDNADTCPEGGVDLDLIVFNNNMVCMGFPSSGFESWYRNPYEQVLSFLDTKFPGPPGGYRVYNLCVEGQHQYDPTAYFHGNCALFPFRDHHPCPLAMIPDFIEDSTKWLSGETASPLVGAAGGGSNEPTATTPSATNEAKATGGGGGGDEPSSPSSVSSSPKDASNRVVAIHCKAGKGRTGLMAICLLMATDPRYANPDDACDHYARERTHNNRGLTHRSQIRYVQYYSKLRAMSGGFVPSMIPVIRLKRITLHDLLPAVGGFTHITVEVMVPTEAEAKALRGDEESTTTSSSPAEKAFADRYGHFVVMSIYRDGSADGIDNDGTAGGLKPVGVAEDKDSTVVFDFQQLLAADEKKTKKISSTTSTSRLGRMLSEVRGDVRITIFAGKGKAIGALSFHTLFVKGSYPWVELDKLYKSNALKDGAGILLDYEECAFPTTQL